MLTEGVNFKWLAFLAGGLAGVALQAQAVAPTLPSIPDWWHPWLTPSVVLAIGLFIVREWQKFGREQKRRYDVLGDGMKLHQEEMREKARQLDLKMSNLEIEILGTNRRGGMLDDVIQLRRVRHSMANAVMLNQMSILSLREWAHKVSGKVGIPLDEIVPFELPREDEDILRRREDR